MKKLIIIAALCAALFPPLTSAITHQVSLSDFEFSCSVTAPNIFITLRTTQTKSMIINIHSTHGNTMTSQVSGHSNNQFQFSLSNLPLDLTIVTNQQKVHYQIALKEQSCQISKRSN